MTKLRGKRSMAKLKPCPLLGPFRVHIESSPIGRDFDEHSVVDRRGIQIVIELFPEATRWVCDAFNEKWNRRAITRRK
jgi:hypothetical protein